LPRFDIHRIGWLYKDHRSVVRVGLMQPYDDWDIICLCYNTAFQHWYNYVK